jgi:hypothetical protein
MSSTVVPDRPIRRTFSGRKRKQGPRQPNGQLCRPPKSEVEAEVVKVVELQPHRRFQAKPSDPLHGYALGRLRVAGMGFAGDGINEAQHDAGETYGKLRVEWCHAKGIAIPNLPSPGMQMVARGLSCSPEPDEEAIIKKLRAYGDARSAVIHYVGPRGAELLDRVVVQDYDPTSDNELGTLRMALNALCHLWRSA